MGDNPIIFAPSHRSYGDFILMSYICFHYKIEIPAVAAGMGKQILVGLIMRVIAHTCAIYVTYHTCFTKTYL
jgi:glycerone phosphate O-acyltransferase